MSILPYNSTSDRVSRLSTQLLRWTHHAFLKCLAEILGRVKCLAEIISLGRKCLMSDGKSYCGLRIADCGLRQHYSHENFIGEEACLEQEPVKEPVTRQTVTEQFVAMYKLRMLVVETGEKMYMICREENRFAPSDGETGNPAEREAKAAFWSNGSYSHFFLSLRTKLFQNITKFTI
jgi:hypothetical protein